MKLESLRLIAYGPFTDCTLALQPGMNVLYGPNEAGKSSALRAVHALFFGMDARTDDNFLHSYQQLRVGGLLVDSQGDRLECVRRKGRQSTLRDGDDKQPIDEEQLRALLGGINEEFFTSVFGIDHERLRDGGDEVIRGQGRVGELLFAAGGVAHLREKQQILEGEASELFKPSGRKPRINSTLTELRDLSDQIRKLQQSPEEWARHDAEHRRLIELQSKIKQDLEHVESSKSRLDRFHKSLGLAGAWKDKRAELSSLTEVVALPDDAEQRFREANENRTLAEAAKARAEERAQQLQSQLTDTNVPTALVSEEARVDELYRSLGSHEKATKDSGVLAGQQRTARNAAKRTIEKLGWDLSVEEVGKRRLPDEQKTRIRTLASRHAEVTAAKMRLERTLARFRKRLAEIEKQLADLDKAEDLKSLRESIQTAVPVLSLEEGLDAQGEELLRLEREASESLARLPRFDGTIEAVCRLAVPADETVDQFDQSTRELANEIRQISELLEANKSEQEQVEVDLEALELEESVPTEEELAEHRRIRDQGVLLAVSRLEGGEVDQDAVKAFLDDVGEGLGLSEAILPSVHRADEIADRLRREASRVASKSQLIAKFRSLDAKRKGFESKLLEARQEQEKLMVTWQKHWQPTGVEPGSPAEMRGWLRKHAQLIDLSTNLASVSAQVAKDEDRVAKSRQQLLEELADYEIEAPVSTSIQSALQTARERLAEADDARRELESLESELDRVQDEAERAEQELAAAKQDLIDWREQWTEALQLLELDADALPEQAEAVLANLDELFRNLDEAEGFRSRIWGIEQTAKEFAQSAQDLAKVIALDLVGRPVEEVASSLNQRLNTAKQAEQELATLTKRLEAEKHAITEAERQLSNSAAALDALATEAVCKSVSDLPEAIAGSRKKRTLEGELTQLESQLAPFCAGQSFEKFVADALQEDADRLPIQIEDLCDQAQCLRDNLEETIASREREAGILERCVGAAEAAEKAEERQALLARLEDDLRQYVVTRTASHLLWHAIEQYKEKAQGPVLAGASEYFNKLTCGAFDGLRADYDESGQEVLVGARPGGGTLLVDAMSEGTRDQLYLALRLGTLDYWSEKHEPIPFIVDDVLLTSDDARAKAALEVLSQISDRNQVLFFTHHQHLVEVAKSIGVSEQGKQIHIATVAAG